jgi:hypothetical protein
MKCKHPMRAHEERAYAPLEGLGRERGEGRGGEAGEGRRGGEERRRSEERRGRREGRKHTWKRIYGQESSEHGLIDNTAKHDCLSCSD